MAEEDVVRKRLKTARATLRELRKKLIEAETDLKGAATISHNASAKSLALNQTADKLKGLLDKSKEEAEEAIKKEKDVSALAKKDEQKREGSEKAAESAAHVTYVDAKMKSIEISEKLKASQKEQKVAELKIQAHRDAIKKAVRATEQEVEKARFILNAKRQQKGDVDASTTKAENELKEADEKEKESVKDVQGLKSKEQEEADKMATALEGAKADESKVTRLTDKVKVLEQKKATEPAAKKGLVKNMQQIVKQLAKTKKLAKVASSNAKAAREKLRGLDTTTDKAIEDEQSAARKADDAETKSAAKAAEAIAATNKAGSFNAEVEAQVNKTKAENNLATKLQAEKAKVGGKVAQEKAALKAGEQLLAKETAASASSSKAMKALGSDLKSAKNDIKNDQLEQGKLKKKELGTENVATAKIKEIKAADSDMKKKVTKEKAAEGAAGQQLKASAQKVAKTNTKLDKQIDAVVTAQAKAKDAKNAVAATKNEIANVNSELMQANDLVASLTKSLQITKKGQDLVEKKTAALKTSVEKAQTAKAEADDAVEAGSVDSPKLTKLKASERSAKAKLSKDQATVKKDSQAEANTKQVAQDDALKVDREKAKATLKGKKVKDEKKAVADLQKDVEVSRLKAQQSQDTDLKEALTSAKDKVEVEAAKGKEEVAKKQLAVAKAKADVTKEATEATKSKLAEATKQLAAQEESTATTKATAERVLSKEKQKVQEIAAAQKQIEVSKARLQDDKTERQSKVDMKEESNPKKKLAAIRDEEEADAAEKEKVLLVKAAIDQANEEIEGPAKQKLQAKKQVGYCGDGLVGLGEACDDKNRKSGDGCDSQCRVERGWSCAGGSATHESVCDQCGNGVVAGQEQCDDGNRKDGDGCSSLCHEETGFTCQQHFSYKLSVVLSKCLRTIDRANDLIEKFDMYNAKCKKMDMVFMMTDIRNSKGSCVNVDAPLGNITEGVQVQKTFVDASPLARPNNFYQQVQAIRTCPMSSKKIGGAARALCKSETAKVCLNTNVLEHKAASRTCKYQVQTSCKEVCAAPRYCAEERGVVHGTDLAGASLKALVKIAVKMCKHSPDTSEKQFAQKYSKKAKLDGAVSSLLSSFDSDKNQALSFAEFTSMIQKKPWSALLRRVFPREASVSVAQVAALGSKKEGFMDPSVRVSLQKLFDSVDIDGSLDIRDGVPQCCFRRCNVPQSWDVPEVMWCYDQHMRVSVGL